ncbi:MAG: GH25 family lysozyme [Oscillospiraceae bacterium]
MSLFHRKLPPPSSVVIPENDAREQARLDKFRRKRKRRRRRLFRVAVLCIAVLCVNAAALLFTGTLQFNRPAKLGYGVRGTILTGGVEQTMQVVKGLDFAYAVAAEGTAFIEPAYEQNRAACAGLLFGAAMRLTFTGSGTAQADNFIAAAGNLTGCLPPLIVTELYGKYAFLAPDAEEAAQTLSDAAARLELEYGVKPVIYCSARAYSLLKGKLPEGCALWVTSVFKAPAQDGWTFWEYSARVPVRGKNGTDYLRESVFRGSERELEELRIP